MRRMGDVFARYLALPLAGILAAAAIARAQDPAAPVQNGAAGQASQSQGSREGRRGQFAGMGRVMGEITAVSGTTLTLKTEDGSTVQVVTTDNTRMMKDREPVKLSDLHPGDGLMAMGNLDAATHTLHAAMVMATDAAQIKAMRENLGKTYIAGRVTAVDLDNAKMTVERQDHVAQTIGFDETTSFKRAVRGERTAGSDEGNRGSGGGFGGGMGMAAENDAALERAFTNGESITLADIKVGDFVMGTGSVKGGVFVPTHLLDSPPGQRRQRNGAAPGAATPAANTQPGTTGPRSQ